ncbi:hypothetical protein E2562_039504 [Oryza meyeriana var. granulata]|uniref:Uncharacterized protein n=1 Tax=Oryza meyeriana var. granulata TaxID=110450 RepID=A0A6G1ED42_9ORYZ|nr:hypothetical protein E2562_039504 [Oryza meyeriana var. granulata]
MPPWVDAPEEDPRFDPRHSRPAWLYTGDRDATRTHVSASHNWEQAELAYMLRVVIGSGNVPASELPREDLVLCNDLGKLALQAILPMCDTKGIFERMSRRALGSVCILGVDGDEARQDGGCRQLESLICTAKVVYNRDVAEVEWERSALNAKRVEAVTVREEATKALRELEDQQEAITILKA